MLYLCAGSTSIRQFFKENRCVQYIGAFTQSPNMHIQLISKSLVARLIPPETGSHDTAILILISDKEVDQLMTMLQSLPEDILDTTIFSMIIDLSRSPHNIWALVSRDITSTLTSIMDSLSERGQVLAAKLVWTVMEMENDSQSISVDFNTVTNNGTLQNGGTHTLQ